MTGKLPFPEIAAQIVAVCDATLSCGVDGASPPLISLQHTQRAQTRVKTCGEAGGTNERPHTIRIFVKSRRIRTNESKSSERNRIDRTLRNQRIRVNSKPRARSIAVTHYRSMRRGAAGELFCEAPNRSDPESTQNAHCPSEPAIRD